MDLYFLKIYIYDLPNNLTSNPKLFADDGSLFSIVTDQNATAYEINNDLHTIITWAYQRRTSFNSDISRQAQEVIFSHKVKLIAHPQLFFNNNPVHETSTQKHLKIFLDFRLKFSKTFGDFAQ